MKKFMIIVDATCDISEDMQKEFGIEAVPGFIHLPDNTDILQFLSWKDNDREEFYNKLKKNPNAYATAPANPEMFAEAFKKYARLGYDMLVLTMSSAMSGTYEFALKGREQALQEFPDTKIHAIDTRRGDHMAGGEQVPLPSGRLARRPLLCRQKGQGQPRRRADGHDRRHQADRRV